jgi:hypothetical protein
MQRRNRSPKLIATHSPNYIREADAIGLPGEVYSLYRIAGFHGIR